MSLPIARPPTFRDFYSFEQHMLNARRINGRPIPSEWYQAPTFYYSNPWSIVGPNCDIKIPSYTKQLDYELEIGVVISEDCENVRVGNAWNYVEGFVIINDFSARDIQKRETAVGLGPAKGKDFATAVGPRLVPIEEVRPKICGFDLLLEMAAYVNGKRTSLGWAGKMWWTFPELIEYASMDCVLKKGDLIGSGTCGKGCLFESEPKPDGWLKEGDVVELEVQLLGSLVNKIVR